MGGNRRELLRSIAAELKRIDDDRETSNGEMLAPEPVRGSELERLIKALQATYDNGKLPVEPWEPWRTMIQCVHLPHKRKESDLVATYYVAADRLREWVIRELTALPSAETAGPEPVARTKSGSVLLFSPNDCPIVNGKQKQELTVAQYNVVMTLLQAGDKRLTKDNLVDKSGHSSAVNILKNLSKSDADWKAVISLAVTTGRGYAII